MKVKILLLMFTVSLVANAFAGDIVVKGAWVRVLPPTQTVTAAYMTIVNHSDHNIVLVSAASDVSSKVEIHQMNDMKGMMSMNMVSNIAIAPGSSLGLKPGGYHLMLAGLFRPLKKGDLVNITLRFLNGQDIEVKAYAK